MIKDLRKNKGITLIALVITVIVLLILAGVTINAIVGNENAMEKAKQARTENAEASELDEIKLAIVNAIAKGNDGKLWDENLRMALRGIIDDTEIEKITGNGPWRITTKLGKKYKIDGYGKIGEKVSPTDIYVSLDGNVLRFYSQKNNISGNLYKDGDTPINLKDIEYNAHNQQVPWVNDRGNIVKVSFEEQIAPTSTAYWFYNCTALIDIEKIENLNTSNVTNMEGMFYVCYELTELNLSNFDTENVINMKLMFQSCRKLAKLNLSNFDTNNVTNMEDMFEFCQGLKELDLSSFNIEKLTKMRCMFYGCYSLEKIYVLKDWDVSNVTDGDASVFSGCSRIRGGDSTLYNATRTDKNMAKIDRGAPSPGYFSLRDQLQVGDYVVYPITYTDVNSNRPFTERDGWRYIGGNQIISTGVPVDLNISNAGNNTYNESKDEADNGWWATPSQVEQRYGASKSGMISSTNGEGETIMTYEYPNYAATLGLKINLPKIKFMHKEGTERGSANQGTYKKVGNQESGQLSENAFIEPNASGATIHALSESEYNSVRSLLYYRYGSYSSDLFSLKDLKDENYNYTWEFPVCWLADAPDWHNNYQSIRYIQNDGGTSGHINYDWFGLRVVVSLPSDYVLTRVDD